jgi:hypothetical protein
VRSLLTGERSTITGTGYARHLKLEVQNGSGTWKNVGDLLGVDYVIGGGWGEDMDQPVGTASVRIRRRNGSTSLSPLVVGSILNVDDDGFYAPLLEKGRAFRAWSATVPNGTLPTSSDWREGMQGRIDTVAWDSDPIVIDCSDLGAWLADTQIKVDGVQYGTVPTGTPLATALQHIIDDTPSGKLTPTQETVYVNTTNDFALTNWLQSGNNKVLDGARALVQQTTADDFRFRYDAAHVFRLTLFDPQRGRSTVDATLGPEEYYPIRRLSSGIVDIRNSGEMDYDGGTVTSPADPATDPSVLNYGERFFRLPANDAISTELQAQTLLDIVVEDLNDGPLDLEVAMPMFWPVQLYDRITFSANSDHFDEDQTLMVAGYRHEFDGLGQATTTLRCGGKVVGAYADWLKGIRTRRTTIETYNQVLAKVTASDATTVTVTVTATSPAGTPTVEYVGATGSATKLSGPAIGVASASGTVWVFTRGTSGSGVGQAQFRAVFPGNINDDDFVTIPEQAPVLTFAEVRSVITASDATTETITVTGLPSGATVELVGVTGSATRASGPAVGVASASGTVWVFNRGTAGGGDGQVQFRAVLSGYQSDDDFVSIPEQGNNAVALAMRARVTATSPTTVTVRVAVADPIPPGTASVTIAYQNLGTGGVTPSSGGTVTPVVSLTEAAGTYIDYVITRPAFGAGAGRVTFTATATSRMSDSDAVDVPEADRDTVYLASRARVIASDATTVTVRYTVADPYPQGANSATLSYQSQGTGGVTPVSGLTVTPAATLTEAAGTYYDYTITRPAFGGGTGRVTFTATAANRVSDSDAVDVPAIEQNTVTPVLALTPIAQGTGSQSFTVTASNPTGGTAPTIVAETADTSFDYYRGGVYQNTLGPGVAQPLLTGDELVVFRPAFDTSLQASVTVTASIAGSGTAERSATIQNQVKAAFGPSLQLNLTIGPTSCSIAYVVIGTLEVSIDGGTWTTAAASPITGITRDSSPHTYDFRAFADSRYAPGTVAIPALDVVSNRFGTLSITGNDSTNQITLTWTFSGESGVTFRVLSAEGALNPDDVESESASSGFSYPSGYDLLPSGGAGSITFRATVEAIGSDGSFLTSITGSHSHHVNAF